MRHKCRLIGSYEAQFLRSLILFGVLAAHPANAVSPVFCSNQVSPLTAEEASSFGLELITSASYEHRGCQLINLLAPPRHEGRAGGAANVALFEGETLVAAVSVQGGANSSGIYSNAFDVCPTVDRIIAKFWYGKWCDSLSLEVQLTRSPTGWQFSNRRN